MNNIEEIVDDFFLIDGIPKASSECSVLQFLDECDRQMNNYQDIDKKRFNICYHVGDELFFRCQAPYTRNEGAPFLKMWKTWAQFHQITEDDFDFDYHWDYIFL